MSLSSRALLEFLAEVEPSLEDPMHLVAAGGTALTLLGVKASTVDIDFTGPKRALRPSRPP